MYFFDPHGEAPMGAQMNSPACRAMRGDGTVGGADRGSVSARTCPGIESMRATLKARSRLYPRPRRSLRFCEPRSLAPRSRRRCGVAKDGPRKAKKPEVSEDIQGRNATTSHQPVQVRSRKKLAGADVWRGSFRDLRRVSSRVNAIAGASIQLVSRELCPPERKG